jgi:hypothetical protein
MWDRQTNRMGQVCIQGDEPRKTGTRTFQNGLVSVDFLGCPDCLHWEGERREIFKSETHQTHREGPRKRKGHLSESPVTSRGTTLQNLRLPKQVPAQTKCEPHRRQKGGLERGWDGRFKTKRIHH